MATDIERDDGTVLYHSGWPDGAIHTPEGEFDRRQAEGEEPPALLGQKNLGPDSINMDQYYVQNSKTLRRLKKLGVE